MPRLTPVVKILLIINVVAFVVQLIIQNQYGTPFYDPVTQLLGLRYVGAESFAPYQFLTHMFLHGDFFHLLGNMYALFIFGPPLETYFNSKKFFLFYMITGLGAAIIHTGVSTWEAQQVNNNIEAYTQNPNPSKFVRFMKTEGAIFYERSKELREFAVQYENNPNNSDYVRESVSVMEELAKFKRNIPTIGASGAVFGILAAFGIVFANVKLVLLFPPIPIKAKYLVIAYGLFELYAIYQANPTDNIAHFAHVGGMIFGFILVKLWSGNENQRWQ